MMALKGTSQTPSVGRPNEDGYRPVRLVRRGARIGSVRELGFRRWQAICYAGCVPASAAGSMLTAAGILRDHFRREHGGSDV